MINNYKNSEKGSTNIWMISTISLILFSFVMIGLSIWAFINYSDQKNNVDTIVSTEVSKAQKDQADADEVKFLERDKEPNRQFVGPDDFGRVTFNYPKTWSVYVDNDGSTGSTYKAYLNPVVVPSVDTNKQFALRVVIEQRDYDKVIDGFAALVKKGDLKSSSFTADENIGTRLDGLFSKDVRGSAVILKIRDKTLTIQTDANTFKADFDALIATIKLNK